MAMFVRYTGEFLSRAGSVWRADIMQEADSAFDEVGALDFPADEPLVLEWEREDKETPVWGSTATLKIISPGDRTYEDLYTIEVGRIRLDVYKDNALYWSGAIDPEFYEEPYERLDGYEVTLTFSDFGILDRIKYGLSGLQSLRGILVYALGQAKINYGELNTDYATTVFADTEAEVITDGGLAVRSENFIDEDGEISSMKDVVEGVLQPLALRMVQREGVIYIYDLNGLYTAGESKDITWDGDTQTMGTDKVANNVKVSFSPYSSADILNDELDYGGSYDVDHVNLTSSAPSTTSEYGEYYSYYPDYSDEHKQGSDWDYNLIAFTIFLHGKATGLKSIGSGCKYFHILPVTGNAAECSGVAYAFRTGGHGSVSTGWPTWKCHGSVPHCTTNEVLTTNRAFLPKLSDDDAKNFKVRVVEEILVDARYNPFSGSTSGNDEGNDNNLKVWTGWAFIPVSVTLYDADGAALYHYRNKDTAQGACRGSIGYMSSTGEWVSGADPGGDCYFEYYNPTDLAEDCGLRGWQGNRHCIGRPDGAGGRISLYMHDSFAQIDNGEYLPYPPAGGYLEVKVFAGINAYDYGESAAFGESGQWDGKNMRSVLRWCLYKAPTVDIVNRNLVFDAAELDDVEYSGYINKSAKEEISIDTICGTAAKVCPTAKGVYQRLSDGLQIQTLKRAARTEHPEKLLIGTLYSQYADRKTTLSGEALIDGGLCCYAEQNQADKRFMLMSDVQNVITDCTEAEYCEFRPDEYDSIEEVE